MGCKGSNEGKQAFISVQNKSPVYTQILTQSNPTLHHARWSSKEPSDIGLYILKDMGTTFNQKQSTLSSRGAGTVFSSVTWILKNIQGHKPDLQTLKINQLHF